MKVKIGPYRNFLGPYQIVDWFKPVFGEERIERFTDGKVFEKLSDWSMPLFNFIEKYKPQRVEKIHIDRFDSWSIDHTLSLIILPMLLQLKEEKHGAPFVDDEDVPEELRSTSAPKVDGKNGETDEFFFKRFDYILDEMIFAMENIKDDSWQEQFHTGESDWVDKKVVIPKEEHGEDDIDGDLVMYEMIEGPNHTASIDREGMKKYSDRIQNGTMLFGKYFRNLWS